MRLLPVRQCNLSQRAAQNVARTTNREIGSHASENEAKAAQKTKTHARLPGAKRIGCSGRPFLVAAEA